MSLNPISEVRYRYRLASEQLERAGRLLSLRDWAGAVLNSQLAVENFAKAIIAAFQTPNWSHDPSPQLDRLAGQLPPNLRKHAEELSTLARQMAPEHGRSTYGEPASGLTPSDLYGEEHALKAVESGGKAKMAAEKTLRGLGVPL